MGGKRYLCLWLFGNQGFVLFTRRKEGQFPSFKREIVKLDILVFPFLIILPGTIMGSFNQL